MNATTAPQEICACGHDRVTHTSVKATTACMQGGCTCRRFRTRGAEQATQRVFALSDGSRVVAVDHGDIGIAVRYEERKDMGRTTARVRWSCVEECIIPRDAVQDVARWMLDRIGGAK